jgi:hypothetical protein
MPMLRVTSWTPSAATHKARGRHCKALIEIYPMAALDRDKVNCEPARGAGRLCRVAPTYELLLPMTKA